MAHVKKTMEIPKGWVVINDPRWKGNSEGVGGLKVKNPPWGYGYFLEPHILHHSGVPVSRDLREFSSTMLCIDRKIRYKVSGTFPQTFEHGILQTFMNLCKCSSTENVRHLSF